MWKWLNTRKRTADLKKQRSEQQEQLELLAEIKTAKQEWENAQRFFEYAMGDDQIDYAIFAMAAAEKRYEMLIRKAKRMPLKWTLLKGGEVY
ncbi:YaaL family protein [Paenibacillus sp. R14(2021)]|uniref:YaaL family protein n=1 Tax=Paenibacillus sp. R14(2021) TaxID=2859228 RepID=UPI001C61141A|nr:YaaL family protein [Paenibacillus sp. R14(2021)]